MKKFLGMMVLLSALSLGLHGCSGGGGGAGAGSEETVWAWLELFENAGFEHMRRQKDPTRRAGYVVVKNTNSGALMAFHVATLQKMYNAYGKETSLEVYRAILNGAESTPWGGVYDGQLVAEYVFAPDPDTPVYEGLGTGHLYQDKENSKDVNYLRAQKESGLAVIELVSLSERFGLSLEAAGTLVEMKNSFREIVGVGRNDKLSAEDQRALADRLQEATGLTPKELLNGWLDPNVRASTLAKAAKYLNTSKESINNFVSLFEELIQ